MKKGESFWGRKEVSKGDGGGEERVLKEEVLKLRGRRLLGWCSVTKTKVDKLAKLVIILLFHHATAIENENQSIVERPIIIIAIVWTRHAYNNYYYTLSEVQFLN